MMAGIKRIFFDANIFNRIVDRSDATELIGHLTQMQTAREIELVTSIQVIEELIVTPDLDKRKCLSDRVFMLIERKIIKPWNQLIREELWACCREQEPSSIFYENDNQDVYSGVLKDIAEGRFSDQCGRINEDLKKEKKHALNRQKSLRKQEKNTVGVHPCSNYQTFDEFYEQEWRSAGPNQVKKLLRKDGIEGSKLDEAVLRVASKQDRLPHLNAFLRVTPALTWADHVGWKQGPRRLAGPKFGDRTDLYHIVCAATSDVLASDDEKTRGVFGSVYPGKMALPFKEFISTLGVQSENRM